jgi:hypothetical protein
LQSIKACKQAARSVANFRHHTARSPRLKRHTSYSDERQPLQGAFIFSKERQHPHFINISIASAWFCRELIQKHPPAAYSTKMNSSEDPATVLESFLQDGKSE